MCDFRAVVLELEGTTERVDVCDIRARVSKNVARTRFRWQVVLDIEEIFSQRASILNQR